MAAGSFGGVLADYGCFGRLTPLIRVAVRSGMMLGAVGLAAMSAPREVWAGWPEAEGFLGEWARSAVVVLVGLFTVAYALALAMAVEFTLVDLMPQVTTVSRWRERGNGSSWTIEIRADEIVGSFAGQGRQWTGTFYRFRRDQLVQVEVDDVSGAPDLRRLVFVFGPRGWKLGIVTQISREGALALAEELMPRSAAGG